MLIPIRWNQLTKESKVELLQRRAINDEIEFKIKLKNIIESVRQDGDVACKKFTEEFDGVSLDEFEVKQNEIQEARFKIKNEIYLAMQSAFEQIYCFHLPQLLKNYQTERLPGIICESIVRPLEKVGLYVPGGNAPLISTVLMLGIPAMIAGCQTRILCSPPTKDGNIDPHILHAASLSGIKKIYKIGGAQAIAAMSFGTETIPKVDKIFGPGNSWVTCAKMLVSQDFKGALYDLPAGPSEVMIIADQTANPVYIAADLLSQLEHGIDSQAICISTDIDLLYQVSDEIHKQLPLLTRSNTILKSLEKSRLIYVEAITEAIDISNIYVPEHLILQISDPRKYLEKITGAGSVFLGSWSPVAVGDYASGTNHVLPTNGYAKTMSGLTVRDFMKTMTVQELSREGLLHISKIVMALANVEQLDAHKRSIELRLGE